MKNKFLAKMILISAITSLLPIHALAVTVDDASPANQQEAPSSDEEDGLSLIHI